MYSCENRCVFFIFFFNDTATTEIYTLSLHDALPIYGHAFEIDSSGFIGTAHGGSGHLSLLLHQLRTARGADARGPRLD